MPDLFTPTDGPRIFATPLGVDFCATLIDGLDEMLTGQPPHARAEVEIWVANARMQRRMETLYSQRGPGFLPRIRPVSALGAYADLPDAPVAVSPLRLRLILADLVSRLMERIPDLAPRSALYDIADGLADLLGEVSEEGVAPEALAAVDVARHAEHWRRAQALLGLIARYIDLGHRVPQEARQAIIVDTLAEHWKSHPPQHPILVAGSTGSRGATARFMAAVAQLPQGAVILPGLDPDMPVKVWQDLMKDRKGGLAGEDHPQFRLAKFAEDLGQRVWDIPDWPAAKRPPNARTSAVSLALRPAPVTSQWRDEAPKLQDLDTAFDGVTLLEADTPQMEAVAIALRLREAVEKGERAALICPDRRLARQVTAALTRWRIRPDDSAGTPLDQSAVGQFLRLVAGCASGPLSAEALIVLLKHPICNSGAARGPHLQRTRELELALRGGRIGTLGRETLLDWAEKRKDAEDALPWALWIIDHLFGPVAPGAQPLQSRVAQHIALAERLAGGPTAEDTGELYLKAPGAAVQKLFDELTAEADAGGAMSAQDYEDFFAGLIGDREVREPLFPHADILIWGTQEARVQGADIVILSGLNEGTWPAAPAADPWLNRQMRADLGLRLPDRVIGLAAHDFQQAMAAPNVWVTRAKRDAETDTVASRWLNRLTNLLQGASPEGRAALRAMRARGHVYLDWAEAVAAPPKDETPAPRPAPAPPVHARPTVLSVTDIERLIRDPYAIYAKRVLRLKPLDSLRSEPDARLRGTILHSVMERFACQTQTAMPPPAEAQALLLELAQDALKDIDGWPIAQRLWYARLARSAPAILRSEAARRQAGRRSFLEIEGAWDVPGTGVTLKAKADRLDRRRDGTVAIFDYKASKPPTKDQERQFNQQLWIEALMVEAGSFGLLPGTRVSHIAYVGLLSGKETAHDIEAGELADIAERFRKRLQHMRSNASAFPARRSMVDLNYPGDYDHLARFGEWDETEDALRIEVGDPDG